MQKFICLISTFMLLMSSVYAQTPSITINSYSGFVNTACIDSPYKLPVTTQGQFNADNKFSVQVRQSYSSTIITEIPAVFNGDKFEFIFVNQSLYANNGSVQVKVISSSPKAESNWSDNTISIYSKGNISLNSLSVSDTLNQYEEIRLQFKGFSNSQTKVTLNDSTKYNFYYSYNGDFPDQQIYTVTKSGTFNIAHAENACGAMVTSGSFKTAVNPVPMRTVSVAPSSICENSEVRISFSAPGAALTAQTKYKIRFVQSYSSNGKPGSAEVPAQLVGNFLVAKFPNTFVLSQSNTFYAQIVTENPSIVGSHASVSFNVSPQPNVIFNSQSQSINLGGNTNIELILSGLPPFVVEMNEGSKYTFNSAGRNTFYPSPSQNTTYSFKSLLSGCGKKEISNSQTLDITVRPGIQIDDDRKTQIFCAGSRVKIKFKSSAVLTGNTKFTIRATDSYETLLFDATRSGDYLEFDLPNRAQGYQNFNYKIVTSSPSMESDASYWYTMQTTPNISFPQYNTYSYNIPSKVQVSYNLIGGGPYKIEGFDGTVRSIENNYNSFEEIYLKATTEFKVKSVSNSCFKNENLPSKTVVLNSTDSPGIYIEPFQSRICDSDSIEITFGTVGKFNPENIFAIQGYTGCCDYKTVKTVSNGGKFKVKLPTTQYYTNGQIRVASTNPVIFSDAMSISVQRPLEQLAVYPSGKAEEPYKFIATQSNLSSISLQTPNSGPPSQIIYSEAGKEKTFDNKDVYSANIPISPAVGVVTEYVIKKATNQCGSIPLNLSTFIASMPYNIQIADQNYSNNFCAGGPISIPFGILYGTTNNASFSLQIWKQGGSDIITLASGETGRILNATLSPSLTPGPYNLRIISSEGAISDTRTIQIGSVSSATLSLNGQSDNYVSAGQTVNLDVKLTGSYPTTVIFEDGTRTTYYSNGSRSVYPVKGTEYSIKEVSNYCGYGSGSGSVSVLVRPSLSVSTDTYNVCEGGNFSLRYSLNGDAILFEDYIRFELIETGTAKIIVLDSTKVLSGTKTLKLPDSMKGSYYQIRCSVRKYDLYSTLNTSITTKPDVTISGNTVINNGGSTRLILKSNKSANGESKYVLSDGTTGSIYSQVGGIVYVNVSPKQTTTYTLTSLSNSCGEGTKSGSAIVEVNPASERSVNITSWSSASGTGACTGDTISVFFGSQGTFTAGNKMTVQISDTTGRNFRAIATTGTSSPLKAILPADMVGGKLYRLRVTASDPNTGSAAYEYPISASQKAHARFASESVVYDGKTNPRIVVVLEGGAPWTYQFGTDVSVQTRQTSLERDNIELYQASPNQYYKLFKVWNGCGLGIIDNPSTVRVEVVTGTEEPQPWFDVTIAPNPTSEQLNLSFGDAAKRSITIYDVKGTNLYNKSSFSKEEQIDVRSFPQGIFIIQIEAKGRKQSYKILKH
jgi:hypothetical protein